MVWNKPACLDVVSFWFLGLDGTWKIRGKEYPEGFLIIMARSRTNNQPRHFTTERGISLFVTQQRTRMWNGTLSDNFYTGVMRHEQQEALDLLDGLCTQPKESSKHLSYFSLTDAAQEKRNKSLSPYHSINNLEPSQSHFPTLKPLFPSQRQ